MKKTQKVLIFFEHLQNNFEAVNFCHPYFSLFAFCFCCSLLIWLIDLLLFCLLVIVSIYIKRCHIPSSAYSCIILQTTQNYYLWPLSINFDHGSTSWLSCLFDCYSVACGSRDRCGRNNHCRKSRICTTQNTIKH